MWKLSLLCLFFFPCTSCGKLESSTSWKKLTDSSIDGKTPTSFYRQFFYQKGFDSNGVENGNGLISEDYVTLDDPSLVGGFSFAMLEDGEWVLSYREFRRSVVLGSTDYSYEKIRTVVRRGTWSIVGSQLIFGGLGEGRGVNFWRNRTRKPGVIFKLSDDVFSKGLKGREVLVSQGSLSVAGSPLQWKSE